MDGSPVWLASTSTRAQSGRIIPTYDWSPGDFARAERRLREVLKGVGDESRERYFRMCVTACFHRALSQAEIAALPTELCNIQPRDLAGGPLEVFWSKGTADTPSTQPCVAPARRYMDDRLYLPIDCGQCEPCQARAALLEGDPDARD